MTSREPNEDTLDKYTIIEQASQSQQKPSMIRDLIRRNRGNYAIYTRMMQNN